MKRNHLVSYVRNQGEVSNMKNLHDDPTEIELEDDVEIFYVEDVDDEECQPKQDVHFIH